MLGIKAQSRSEGKELSEEDAGFPLSRSPGEIPREAVVVGGGIAGLACAVALSDNGVRVTLIERDSILGGRAASWPDERTGDAVDIGPHVVHTEYRNFLALLDRL